MSTVNTAPDTAPNAVPDTLSDPLSRTRERAGVRAQELPTPATTTQPPAAKPKHPVLELLARHRAVFRAAWAVRHELTGPRRLADEAAFLPAALSLQDTPVHPAPRRLAYLLMALFVLALAWSIFGEIDIVAVAPGRIMVNEHTKVIQPLENSMVQKVLVKDGDHVEAGQALVALDPTGATADRTSVIEQRKSAESEVLRTASLLRALDGPSVQNAGRIPLVSFVKSRPATWSSLEVETAQAQLQAEWSDITAKLAKLASETRRREADIATARAVVDKLEATLPLSRQRETDIQGLTNQGFMSGHAGQDRQRERIELERDLATQRAQLLATQATLTESENARSAYLAETRRGLFERQMRAELTRLQASQEQTKATQREKLTTLIAPVAGTVQQLAIHTTGGVVTQAQALMVIVPDGAEVKAEVTLDNKDIGFVNAGQEATIKLETFNYTRYGTVPARVSRVTPDAVNDEKRGAIFPVTLQLSQYEINIDGKPIKLGPGMNITAEIKTGKRRVIEYLLSPIQRAGNESLRER